MELHENEKVLWTGKPMDFKLVNNESKKNIIRAVAVNSVLFIIFSVIVCVSDIGFNLIFELVALSFFYLLARSPFKDYKEAKKCVYYVTDKRIITDINEKDSLSLPRANIKVKKIKSENGGNHIVFGAMTELKTSQLLLRSYNPYMTEGVPEGLCFYNIKDDKKLDEILSL